jgi:hypothetical protein
MTMSMFRFSLSFLLSVVVGLIFRAMPSPKSEPPPRNRNPARDRLGCIRAAPSRS